MLFFLCSPIAYVVAGLLVGGAWRRSRVISPIEYTRSRYNLPTQQCLGWALSVCYTLTCGAQLLAIAFVVSVLTGISIPAAVIGIGIAVIAYTVLAGLWAAASFAEKPEEALLAAANTFRHGELPKATSSQDVWFYLVLASVACFSSTSFSAACRSAWRGWRPWPGGLSAAAAYRTRSRRSSVFGAARPKWPAGSNSFAATPDSSRRRRLPPRSRTSKKRRSPKPTSR